MPNDWLEQIPHSLLRSNHPFPFLTEMSNAREGRQEKEMKTGSPEEWKQKYRPYFPTPTPILFSPLPLFVFSSSSFE